MHEHLNSMKCSVWDHFKSNTCSQQLPWVSPVDFNKIYGVDKKYLGLTLARCQCAKFSSLPFIWSQKSTKNCPEKKWWTGQPRPDLQILWKNKYMTKLLKTSQLNKIYVLLLICNLLHVLWYTWSYEYSLQFNTPIDGIYLSTTWHVYYNCVRGPQYLTPVYFIHKSILNRQKLEMQSSLCNRRSSKVKSNPCLRVQQNWGKFIPWCHCDHTGL